MCLEKKNRHSIQNGGFEYRAHIWSSSDEYYIRKKGLLVYYDEFSPMNFNDQAIKSYSLDSQRRAYPLWLMRWSR